MRVEYNGAKYFGWQKQKPGFATVHQAVDRALSKYFKDDLHKSMSSSRTDARVHALGQGVLLITYKVLEDLEEFKDSVNELLPEDIIIHSIVRAPLNFRIINDVVDKEYLYFFTNDTTEPEEHTRYCNFHEPLDFEKMQKTCQLLVGEHNFKNFQFKPSINKTMVRTIFECELIQNPTMYDDPAFPKKIFVLRIKGNGFLRNMIRILMGVIVNIGSGLKELKDLEDALAFPDQQLKVGFIAPACGLYLHYISYDEESLKFQ